jgi:hypothetical protein
MNLPLTAILHCNGSTFAFSITIQRIRGLVGSLQNPFVLKFFVHGITDPEKNWRVSLLGTAAALWATNPKSPINNNFKYRPSNFLKSITLLSS